VLEAVLAADRTRYPDPAYTRLRERLGVQHGVPPDRIVPGAGASELILRLVRDCTGDVLAWSPSFVEYRKAAHICDRVFRRASDPDRWLEQIPASGIAFLCQPNNPDGHVHSLDFLEAAADACRSEGCLLVLDLAYASFCLVAPAVPDGCELLLAPNKMFGLTGIRAGILVSSDRIFADSLRESAPSWPLGAEAVAFLEAASEPSAMAWFRSTIPELRGATDRLRSLLEGKGWVVDPSSTHFFRVKPPALDRIESDAALSAAWTFRLRQDGIKVRDLSNVGLPGWLRFSARPGMEMDHLARVLKRIPQAGC
jgi:histidinol-phosphate aminotransferase